jgi:hypothetical protein
VENTSYAHAALLLMTYGLGCTFSELTRRGRGRYRVYLQEMCRLCLSALMAGSPQSRGYQCRGAELPASLPLLITAAADAPRVGVLNLAAPLFVLDPYWY